MSSPRFRAAVGHVWVLVWIVVAGMGSGCSSGFQEARGRWSGLQWTDLDGAPHRVAESVGEKGLVMVYVSVDCPLANRCLPEIEALSAEMARRGLRVVRVYAHAQEGPDEIRRHGAEYGLQSEVFRDADGSVARAFGVSHTPEAVAVDPGGQLIYRGRINDQFERLGVSRPQPNRHDLAEALEAHLSGQKPFIPWAPAVGCRLRP
jgi:peroxiredoxin